jgi:alkylhydroperoxidase/carboxymuconolactone decarboxylase family protein YurZ
MTNRFRPRSDSHGRRDRQAVKRKALSALVAAAEDARAAGASKAEIAGVLQFGTVGAAPPETRHPLRAKGVALWVVALVVCAALFLQTAPLSRADVCGDGAQVPAGGCQDPGGDPPSPPGLAKPPWLGAIESRDPQFGDSYMAMRERILKDGAIPAKYKLLMAMVTDAIAAHPDGVRTLAGNARAAGASEPEVTEAVEVGYLFGGTAALVMGANAFNG